MPVNIGSKNLKAAYVGNKPIKAIYLGSKQVWTSKPTEVLPNNTSTNGTRDNFRALLVKHGLNYKTVEELPFNLDTSNVTKMSSMFRGCSSLVSVPDLDTSQVTNMYGMFQDCSSLVSVPDLDTSRVRIMGYMFYNCSSLTDGNVRLIGRHPSVSTFNMLTGSGLTREPFYDTSGNPI